MVGARSQQRAPDKDTGEILKVARLKRKLSIDEVAATLRIPPKHLVSLEEGDLTSFSAEVYARGAYMKYARYLGVDTKSSYHAFLRTLSGARERVPLKLPLPSTWLQRVLTPTGVLVVVVGLAVTTVAGYIGGQVREYIRVPALSLIEPTEVVLEGDEVKIVGQAESEAEVTVNGAAVLLNEEDIFVYNLPLRPGINVLQIEATGASGRTNVIKQDLLVPRK